MQFQKKTTFGNFGGIIKLLIKVCLIIVVLFVGVILLDKIDFPSPIKKIEKIISNENFKTVK